MDKSKIIRIIDANYNRAKEALRVCEDIARFILDHKNLTARFKSARHELTQIILKFPHSYKDIVSERKVSKDVGRTSFKLDKKKMNESDVFASNIQRAQEAVRVLEEWAKVISIPTSKKFQLLRFRLYELEKKTFEKL